jgi:hypothetical protein
VAWRPAVRGARTIASTVFAVNNCVLGELVKHAERFAKERTTPDNMGRSCFGDYVADVRKRADPTFEIGQGTALVVLCQIASLKPQRSQWRCELTVRRTVDLTMILIGELIR